MADFAGQCDVVIHQALHAGDRRRLVDEIREVHLDVAGLRFQFFDHVAQHAGEIFDRNFAFVAVEDLDKARHVRAFEVVRQADVHVEYGDGVLNATRAVENPNRVPDGLDADPIDGDLPRVG